MNGCRQRGRVGFTLLELLAVLLIGALLMGIMIPNLGPLRSRTLRQHAERIVAKADLARQRAVITGAPHRLVIDLESSTYGLEWMRNTAESEADDLTEDSGLLPTDKPVSLKPPAQKERTFARLPGILGRTAVLTDGVEFAVIEIPGGFIDSGTTFVTFERDGTASFTRIVLDDPDGRELVLEIQPLADTVRIFDDGL